MTTFQDKLRKLARRAPDDEAAAGCEPFVGTNAYPRLWLAWHRTRWYFVTLWAALRGVATPNEKYWLGVATQLHEELDAVLDRNYGNDE